MQAGFARECITPALGTRMMGFAERDRERGCTGVHDDLFVRALYAEHEGETALIMGFDLCFLGREDADRLKGAIGRRLDLSPRQILLNTSHTHVGPSVGTWAYAGYAAPDRLYLNRLEHAVVAAACRAAGAAEPVTLWAGTARTSLPMCRRRPEPAGSISFRPHPDGTGYPCVPLCLLRGTGGRPVALLFAVSCHPSSTGGWEISADYPGAAMRRLDEYLGVPCSLSLPGAGGDSKPANLATEDARWRSATWEEVDAEGRQVADEVMGALAGGLAPVEPAVWSHAVEMEWPLEPAPDRAAFEEVLANPGSEVRRLWAERQLLLLDGGEPLPAAAALTAQGIQLGRGLRLIGIEGELVAPHGTDIRRFFGDGVTFALGYTNGQGLYLPNTAMLPEGGYEVESAYEYGYPSRLAPGMDATLRAALEAICS